MALWNASMSAPSPEVSSLSAASSAKAAATAFCSAPASSVGSPLDSRRPVDAARTKTEPAERPGAAGRPWKLRSGMSSAVRRTTRLCVMLIEVAFDERDERCHGSGGIGPGRPDMQGGTLRHLEGHDFYDAFRIDPRPARGERKLHVRLVGLRKLRQFYRWPRMH